MSHDIMQLSYPDLYVLKVLSIKKILKISPSMTENTAIDGCFSVGCTLFTYSWGAIKQGSLPLSHITSSSNFVIKFKKVFSCIATYLNLVPCKETV